MRLAYLGRVREQAAPDVVRSFVLDRDIVHQEPGFAPIDVRVLLTRNQLSDLRDTVRAILQAQAGTRLSPEDFFSRVRGAAAATIRDPRRLGASSSGWAASSLRSSCTGPALHQRNRRYQPAAMDG